MRGGEGKISVLMVLGGWMMGSSLIRRVLKTLLY
jgi:hypothetical protein